jgi:hypothetical protein
MASEDKSTSRPSLSLLALLSFIASFAIARTFTAFSGRVIVKIGGFHIHHIYYGIVLLAIGGWLGISYNEERVTRLAAVLYGVGGGLIGDEIGLLLTNFESYWTGITYTIMVVFIVFVIILILFERYSRAISAEIKGFTRSRASFYFGILLAAVSIEFLTSRNSFIAVLSTVTTAAACVIIVAYIIQRIRTKQ